MKYALNIFPSIVLFLFFIPFLFRQVTELRILLFKQRKLIKLDEKKIIQENLQGSFFITEFEVLVFENKSIFLLSRSLHFNILLLLFSFLLSLYAHKIWMHYIASPKKY